MLFTLNLLCTFIAVGCRSVALLINTSKNFYNYRHMSNIHAMHYLLQDIGLPPAHILCITGEDPFLDPRNILRDAVHFSSSISVPYLPMQISPISDQYILNILHLRHPDLYKLDKADSLIVYMCGHAREGFFKVSDRYFIFKDDLAGAIRSLSERLARVMVILDTCQAASLVDDALPPNVCVVTTSSADGFSFSHPPHPLLGTPGIDEAVLHMYRRGIDKEMPVDRYFESFNGGGLNSVIKCHGNTGFRFTDFLNGTEEDAVTRFEL